MSATCPNLEDLPLALTTKAAAGLLGVSENALWRSAQRGDAPVPFYRWGRALRWPRQPIVRLLHLNESSAVASEEAS